MVSWDLDFNAPHNVKSYWCYCEEFPWSHLHGRFLRRDGTVHDLYFHRPHFMFMGE